MTKFIHSYNRRRVRINESSLFCQVIFSGIFLVFPHGSIVLFDVRRKIVRPVILGDEIEVGNRGWADGSQKGFSARITDRGGGKSGKQIGVIRSGPHQIFFGQISIKISYSIDHGGITLERDLLSETIVKHGRDQRLLLGERGLFFDDGG